MAASAALCVALAAQPAASWAAGAGEAPQEPPAQGRQAPEAPGALPPNDAPDASLASCVVASPGVFLYAEPSLGSEAVAALGQGELRSFYPWDAAGEWGWSWVGEDRVFLPLGGFDVLPPNDAPDASLRWGYSPAPLERRAAPSSRAPLAGSTPAGVVQFYPWDAAGGWGWAWSGDERYYVSLSGVEPVPPNDSADPGLWSGYAPGGGAELRSAPCASAPAVARVAPGELRSFYRWDAAGEWGWSWVGDGKVYLPLGGFDLVAPHSAADWGVQWGYLHAPADRFGEPSDRARPSGAVLPAGMTQFYLWDASGEWGWAWSGDERYFFRLADMELLPKNDAADRSLQSGTALAEVGRLAYPSDGAPRVGAFSPGERIQFYLWDAAGEWAWAWSGDERYYFRLADVEVDPKFYRQEGTAMYLDIEWAGQPNGYYCGPASGYMVLNHLGAHTSESGVSLTMDNLAGYMGVDSSGTDSTGFLNALNNWLGRYDYQLIASPSYDQVHSAVMDAFSTGYPTVVHTYERRGGPHYNGHGNSSMGHFMVVDGYDTATDAVYIADPWAGVWSASSQKFWYPSLREFTATYIMPYRYVYFH